MMKVIQSDVEDTERLLVLFYVKVGFPSSYTYNFEKWLQTKTFFNNNQ